MCTSIVSNREKTIVGWNLDILGMEHRVSVCSAGVFIEINDKVEGWMPLFGVNARGDFVGMPTCWPYDSRSDGAENNIINLDIDLLLMKTTFEETLEKVKNNKISSVDGLTFMSQISNRGGDVLQIIPGQGYTFSKKPKYKVLTNFSPFKQDSEKHDWMGLDRYKKAVEILENAGGDFGVKDCFKLLSEVSQTVCPTVVSMVYDATEHKVYWCENREYGNIKSKEL